MSENKLHPWGAAKFWGGLLLAVPGTGVLVWIVSNADKARLIRQSTQNLVHGHFDGFSIGVVLTQFVLVCVTAVGYRLINSSLKR
jgi:hypothetical protein